MIKNFLKMRMPYSPIKVSIDHWNKRYIEGAWDRLHEIDELARYSLIVGYIHFLNKEGRILDVGCGEGLLYERLCKCQLSNYLGIDISYEAIAKAQNKNRIKDRFIVAPVETFITEEKFNFIVFNEALYYIDKPLITLKRYENFLSANGFFIVSMNDTIETKKIWQEIEKHYIVVDGVCICNIKGVRWAVKVFDVGDSTLKHF